MTVIPQNTSALFTYK